MTAGAETRHAGLIAMRLDGFWTGALIQGASGAGKSDLALRALHLGLRLVADDRVVLFVSAGRLFGRAPPPLIGLLEQRGLGVVSESAIPLARVALIVRCETRDVPIERLPEPASETLLGLTVPRVDLHPFEDSAPAKLRRALEYLGAGARKAYQAARAPPGPAWEA